MKLTRIVALAAVVGFVAGPGATPALAGPDQRGTITISTVESPWDNAGLLTLVEVQAPAPVTSITAHIMNGGTDVLDVSDFVNVTGTFNWQVATPIQEGSKPGELPLGNYQVTVDIADQAGDTATIPGNGPFWFTIHPTLTMTSDRPVFTYLHQTARLSGTLTGLWPDGTTKALPGYQVYVADSTGAAPRNQSIYVGRTDKYGRYNGTFAPDFLAEADWPDYYGTYVMSTVTLTGVSSVQALPLTAKADPVTVTAKITPDRIKYGAKATISGEVVFHEGSVSGPVAGDSLTMSDQLVDRHATGTTDSNGRYNVPLPATASTTWYVHAQGRKGAVALWFNYGNGHAPIAVAVPVTFTSFNARLTPLGYILVGACLKTMLPRMPRLGGPDPRLTIQYSRNPHGPWSKLGSSAAELSPSSPPLALQWARSCRGSQTNFETFSVPGRLINAYYRAVVFATAYYGQAVSPAVHSSLYATRITNTSVSPTSVSSGGHAAIKGRLWRQSGRHWAAYTGRRVTVIYRIAGKKTWYLLGTCTSSARGWFRLKFTDNGVTADLRAVYLGDKIHLWSQGSIVRITSGSDRADHSQPRTRHPVLGLGKIPWLTAVPLPGTGR